MCYKTVREAEAAIQIFDGLDLGQGNRLKVALALAKQKPAFTHLQERVSDGASDGTKEHTDDDVVSR